MLFFSGYIYFQRKRIFSGFFFQEVLSGFLVSLGKIIFFRLLSGIFICKENVFQNFRNIFTRFFFAEEIFFLENIFQGVFFFFLSNPFFKKNFIFMIIFSQDKYILW